MTPHHCRSLPNCFSKRSGVTQQDMSWRRLQHVFSVTIVRLPRRLEYVLKTCLEDVLEDQKLLRWRRLEDVLKTCIEDVLKVCLEDVLKTCLEDVLKTLWRQTKFLLGIFVSNKSKCVSSKSVFHGSISDKGESKMHKLEPNNFTIPLILELKQHLYFKN